MKFNIKTRRIKTESSDYGSDGIIRQEILEKKIRDVAERAIRETVQRSYTIQLRNDSGNSRQTTAFMKLFDKVYMYDEWEFMYPDYKPNYAKDGLGLVCACKNGKSRPTIYDAKLDGTSESNTRYDMIAEKLISDIK